MRHEIESGYHPDADQISAFVEHALSAHEQQQMLAHLAVCPECRTTVAMSLPLQNEAATVTEKPRRIRWLTGWRLALPATAFAAITILVIFLLRNGSHQQQAVNPPVQLSVSQSPPAIAPPPTSRAEMPAPHPKRVEPPTPSGKTVAKPSQLVAGRDQMSKQQLQSFTSTNQASVQSIPLAAAASPAASPTKENAAAPPPVQQPSATAPATKISDAKKTLPVESVHGAIGGPVLKGVQNAALLPLPSGLPILSEATHLRQILAIDTENHIFLSDDGGATWKAVPARWRGHAVQASLVSYGSPSTDGVLNGLSFQRETDNKLDYLAGSSPIPQSERKPSANTPTQGIGIALTGTIADQTGAAISGATITATATTGQLAGTATSDANGHFMLSNLSPGVYDMTTRSSGFQQQLTRGVNVSATQSNVANVTLSVGASAQTVEVEAATPQLKTVEPPALAAESIAAYGAVAPPIFEIVTDKDEHWTSPDGMSWTRK